MTNVNILTIILISFLFVQSVLNWINHKWLAQLERRIRELEKFIQNTYIYKKDTQDT